MRTNIEIDDKLMRKAMKASGAKTKKETVEKALEMFVRIRGQAGTRKLRGTLHWESPYTAADVRDRESAA